MPRIHIMTYQAYCNKGYIDETQRTYIPASDVVAKLNRETGEGPDEYYIVSPEYTAEQLAVFAAEEEQRQAERLLNPPPPQIVYTLADKPQKLLVRKKLARMFT
jgi:hypothetical protein